MCAKTHSSTIWVVMATKYLTEEERRSLQPVLDKVEEAHRELERSLEKLGRGVPDEEGARCFRCDCESYLAPTRPDRPKVCTRPGCGHAFGVHDVW